MLQYGVVAIPGHWVRELSVLHLISQLIVCWVFFFDYLRASHYSDVRALVVYFDFLWTPHLSNDRVSVV